MLPHDFDLTSAHLQALSSREAIVAFFAQLGYNTEARLKQNSAALGFTEALAHEVTHVERVADHENGGRQVYLLALIGFSLSEARIMARLRTEYDKSVETLKPLKAQLAWTDGVINQIAYRLPQGVGAEKINVVEGEG
jgi:hypothetical protein